jgi:hypothetical protein
LYDIDTSAIVEMMSNKMLQILHQRRRRTTTAPDHSPLDDGLAITIRFAYPDDDGAVARLAALDSQPVPDGPLLVAEVAGELWAAVTIGREPVCVADPFRHTAALLELLRERADRLADDARRSLAPRLTAELAWR